MRLFISFDTWLSNEMLSYFGSKVFVETFLALLFILPVLVSYTTFRLQGQMQATQTLSLLQRAEPYSRS